jgi:primosomal protein N'
MARRACPLGLGDGERADEWRHPRGRRDIAAGRASPCPLADVGFVVVDEEHDAAYKSD